MPRYTPEGETPTECACCSQPSNWVGWRPKPGMPFLFFCENLGCQAQAERLYAMTESEFSDINNFSIWDGAVKGGEYLDSIGVTDIAKMSQEQFFELGKAIVTGYQDAIRERIKQAKPERIGS